jgi:adenylate kinase
MTRRALPNILVCGTPGTGKSTLSMRLAEEVPELRYVDVGQLIKDHQLVEGRDEVFDALIPDEDMVVDHLDPDLSLDAGGFLLDYHDCDFFPGFDFVWCRCRVTSPNRVERWFDKVVVLRTNNTVLYDRLVARLAIRIDEGAASLMRACTQALRRPKDSREHIL